MIFLLDTNIIVPWINLDYDLADKINKSDTIYIASVVIGELYYGAMNSIHIQKNIDRIDWAIASFPKLKIDEITSLEFGKIKAVLKKKGKPIPDNDIWIAALTIQHKLTLVTRDKHFAEVTGLHIKHW